MQKKFLSITIIIIIVTLLAGCGSATGYYKDGKKYLDKGKYEEATVCFTKAIEANPNRADYYIDYGMALIELGKYKEALEQLEEAYLDKDMLIVRENNKKVLRGKGIVYYRMQNYKKAAEEFEKALNISELSELDMDILYYMGDALKSIGSYKKAVKTYTKILAKDKDNALAFGNRGLCYKGLGEYEKSLADYDHAISLEPSTYDFYFGKYFLLIENSDKSMAAEVLVKADEIKDDTKEGKYNKAKVHYLQKNYEAALVELNTSITDGFTEANYYLGEIYRSSKDYAKAIYYYDTYINAGKVMLPKVYNQIASCLIKADDYKKALDYLELGIAYNQAETLKVLKKNEIIAYENLGEFDKAKEKLEEYLESFPEDTKALREVKFIDTRLKAVVTEPDNEQ